MGRNLNKVNFVVYLPEEAHLLLYVILLFTFAVEVRVRIMVCSKYEPEHQSPYMNL